MSIDGYIDDTRDTRLLLSNQADFDRVDAVRAHLLELSGDVAGAREAYLAAAGRTLSRPEQPHLQSRAADLTP